MTRRLGRGDAQRGRARLALTVVALLTVGLLLGLSPGGPLSAVMAEVNGTPTSTTTESNAPAATSTPAQPGTATIDLVNPSAYVDPVIVSNKGDTDTSYHLVAAVGNVTAVTTPTVDFEITGNNQQQSLPATRIGDTDTWHAFWTVSQANADYTVTAKLFGGSGTPAPVDEDSQAVTVDKSKETVEMTYPTAGGPLGMFDPDGPADFGFVVDATVSADATGVRAFYSTSPVGTEPNWRRCAQQITVSYSTAGNRRIGCTVPNSHFSSTEAARFELRAVAVVAEGTDDFEPAPTPNCTPPDLIPGPPPLCPTVDSGDAHRVFGYIQTASSVSIAPPTVSAARNNCQELAATVLDGQSRPIWRADVDVHAVGPTDGLQFGAIPERTRDWQPADAGGHTGEEPTNNCGEGGTPPAQAEHDTPAANDSKHIETKPADQEDGGSDTSGGFPFALRSPEQGTTLVEAWADGNVNDVKNDTEPSGGATITWTGPSATQSSSRPPSQSPTRSPTTSASVTRSPTTSQSPTRGSPTSSTTPGPSSRTVTLETSRNTVVFGKSVDFSGIVDSQNAACESGQTVKIQRQTQGAAGFSEVATAVTDTAGVYRLSLKPAENAEYRAFVEPSASCQEAISVTRPLLVRVKVGLGASDRRVRKGQKVRFLTTVKPCGAHDATDVVLFRRTGREFEEIGRKGLNASCQATFRVRVKRFSIFQARWPSQDSNHESGASPKRKIEVRKRSR